MLKDGVEGEDLVAVSSLGLNLSIVVERYRLLASGIGPEHTRAPHSLDLQQMEDGVVECCCAVVHVLSTSGGDDACALWLKSLHYFLILSPRSLRDVLVSLGVVDAINAVAALHDLDAKAILSQLQ